MPKYTQAIDRWVRAAIVALLGVYKEYLSPLIQIFHISSAPVCRFYPSCSLYAQEAFRKKPFFVASYLTICRVAKCRPGRHQGFDPLL